MADRDKVIRALHCCTHIDGIDCMYCPYNHNDENCTALMSMDVLELLKEQEAKVPSIMQDADGIWAMCPTCGNKLRAILAMKMDTYFPKYCQECGQEVKWDG